MAVGIYKKVARDIMTQSVATIRPNETLHDALAMLSENRVTSLPVTDAAGVCLGVISQTDILAAVFEADVENSELGVEHPLADVLFGRIPLDDLTNQRVDDLMSDEVVSVGPDDLVTALADKMLGKRVHHLPVCGADGVLLGVVSTMDILSALRAPLG